MEIDVNRKNRIHFSILIVSIFVFHQYHNDFLISMISIGVSCGGIYLQYVANQKQEQSIILQKETHIESLDLQRGVHVESKHIQKKNHLESFELQQKSFNLQQKSHIVDVELQKKDIKLHLDTHSEAMLFNRQTFEQTMRFQQKVFDYNKLDNIIEKIKKEKKEHRIINIREHSRINALDNDFYKSTIFTLLVCALIVEGPS